MANISNKSERNQLNLAMRQQPWYQDWFQQRGLDPNMVKLNDQQRTELQRLVVSRGFLDPSDGHIDQAGNVSDFHGWKGLPTAAKIAIAGGVTAATLGAAGAFTGPAAGSMAASAGAPAATDAAIFGSAAAQASAATAASTVAAVAPRNTLGNVANWVTSKWGTVGDWGLDLYNNWQSSRAASNRYESELGVNERDFLQRQKEFEAQLRQREKEYQDRLVFDREQLTQSQKQWADRYGLDTAQFQAMQNQWADKYALDSAMWQQQEATRAPYRSLGEANLAALALGMGTPMRPVERVAAPPASPRVAPPAPTPFVPPTPTAGPAPSAPAAVPSAPVVAAPQTVLMQAPDGTTKQVKSSDVDHYLKAGAVLA